MTPAKVRPHRERWCLYCGRSFKAHRSDNVYCSQRCGGHAARNRMLDRADPFDLVARRPHGRLAAPVFKDYVEAAEDLDHIEPSRQGPSAQGATGKDWADVTAACKWCNRSKSANSLLRFMLSRPLRLEFNYLADQLGLLLDLSRPAKQSNFRERAI
jgi:predicted nucleic acid-binding Zn ribbon protein